MLACRDTVTLWHKERENGKDVFLRQVIPVACKWNETSIRSVSDGKAHIASTFSVIVPECPDFKCAVGDIMALGAVQSEITGEKGNTAAELKTALLPHVFTVKSVRDNTRLKFGAHYEIEGV